MVMKLLQIRNIYLRKIQSLCTLHTPIGISTTILDSITFHLCSAKLEIENHFKSSKPPVNLHNKSVCVLLCA